MSPSILKKTDMGWMLSSPLVGKWSMSGYVKVVRGYGASFRIADCLNAPLMDDRGKCHLSGIWQLTHS